MYNKISVITVCYNMVDYIEQTIQSVLNQGYPNLEYIIVDGGSTDGTIEIVKKYIDKVSIFISEPDNGMYDALAKGFKYATGDIYAWINADDIYLPWSFKFANEIFNKYHEVNWISGRSTFMNENAILTDIFPKCGAKNRKDILNGWCRSSVLGYLQQEGMFWRAELYNQSGGFNINYKYAGDFDLWTKFANYSECVFVDLPLAVFMRRTAGLSIGSKKKYLSEIESIIENKPRFPSFLWRISSLSVFVHFLRFLTFRRVHLILYSHKNANFICNSIVRNASSQTLGSLLNHYSRK